MPLATPRRSERGDLLNHCRDSGLSINMSYSLLRNIRHRSTDRGAPRGQKAGRRMMTLPPSAKPFRTPQSRALSAGKMCEPIVANEIAHQLAAQLRPICHYVDNRPGSARS